MVKNAIVLGLLLALSVPASAGGGKSLSMGDSVIEVRDRDHAKACVKSADAFDQEIDEDSDEGRSSKTKKIATQKSKDTDGFFWSAVKAVRNWLAKVFSF